MTNHMSHACEKKRHRAAVAGRDRPSNCQLAYRVYYLPSGDVAAEHPTKTPTENPERTQRLNSLVSH